MFGAATFIPVNHARDYLRQHYAIDAGLDNMDYRPLGSDPRNIDPDTRESCRERMERCRERAHEELAGLIGGAKIDVWKGASGGSLDIAEPQWAQIAFDTGMGREGQTLYFRTSEFVRVAAELTSQASRDFFGGLSAMDVLNRPLSLFDRQFFQPRREWNISGTETRRLKWGLIETFAWIVTGSAVYAEVLALRAPPLGLGIALSILCEWKAVHECACAASNISDQATRKAQCQCLMIAGHQLWDAIRLGLLTPFDKNGRDMPFAIFRSVGTDESAQDWLRLQPQPLFASSEVIAQFPASPPNQRLKTDDEVVDWCRSWINEGKGGMDKAWDTFKHLPDSKGLSRDDVFRPAWKQARSLRNQ
ncbi:MAG: hypothetical protein ABIT04_11695 [Novosphingobium sp.]